jgi:hypothetical protein
MAKAKAVKPEVSARAADPVDPKAIDTSSANVQDVRKMWQQAYSYTSIFKKTKETHTHMMDTCKYIHHIYTFVRKMWQQAYVHTRTHTYP